MIEYKDYKEADDWREATWTAMLNSPKIARDSELSELVVHALLLTLVSNCEKCGCAIGAMPKGDALCCSCRYGEHSSRGYRNHVADMDVVDTMSVNASRFRSGSEFWPGVKEKA